MSNGVSPALWGVTALVLLRLAVTGAAADTIYVSNEKDNTITVVDGASLTLVKTIPVGQRPRGIVLSKDENSLYICASDSDHIEVLDLAADKVVRTLPSGADPEFFALDPTGKLLYVANEDDNLVTLVDIDRGEVVTEIPVGVEPEGMGISPDGKYLVNTSETTNMAHVIDTAKREVVANILVDSRPRRAVWTADGAQFWVSAESAGQSASSTPPSARSSNASLSPFPGCRPRQFSRSGSRLLATASSPSSHSDQPTALPWWTRRVMRSYATCWSANGYGAWRSIRIESGSTRRTGSATTSR